MQLQIVLGMISKIKTTRHTRELQLEFNNAGLQLY